MKTYRHTDGYRSADLLEAAAGHLSAAKALFQDEHVEHLDSAGYLAHLSVELLLKGMLLQETNEFPETHSLQGLHSQVVPYFPGARLKGHESPYRDILIALDRFYALRYPSPTVSPGVSRGDWNAVESLVERLLAAMPCDLREDFHAQCQRGKSGRAIVSRQPR